MTLADLTGFVHTGCVMPRTRAQVNACDVTQLTQRLIDLHRGRRARYLHPSIDASRILDT